MTRTDDPAVPAAIRETLQAPLEAAAGREEPEVADRTAERRELADDDGDAGGSDRTVVEGEEGEAEASARKESAEKGEETTAEGEGEVRSIPAARP